MEIYNVGSLKKKKQKPQTFVLCKSSAKNENATPTGNIAGLYWC